MLGHPRRSWKRAVDIVTAAGSLNFADLGRFFPDAARVLRAEGALIVYDFSAGRRFPEAEELLRRAHAALASSLGPRHDRTLEARRRLDDLYRARGRPGAGAGTPGTAIPRPR